MRAVNLLPIDLQVRKSIRHEDPAVVVGSALGVVVMIFLGAAFFMAHGHATSEQKRLTDARLELAALSVHKKPTPKPKKVAPITPIVPPPTITNEEASWLSAVSTSLSQRIAWDRVLREVSLVMPDDVTLTSMTMTAPTASAVVPGAVTASAPAQGFVIAGSAFSYDSVARLLSRLSLVPDLSDVTLTSTGSAGAAGTTGSTGSTGGSSSAAGGVTFNISAAVKGAPAPAAPATTPAPAATDTTATTTDGSSA
jgi:hypothetical protein